MKEKILIYMLAAMLAVFSLAGCAPRAAAEPAPDGGRLSVVATIFPLYDFARAVSGGLADVALLISPGAEVHSFDPTAQDIMKIQSCDVFVYVGGRNDAWVDTVLASADMSGKTVVKLMDAVTPVEEEIVEACRRRRTRGKKTMRNMTSISGCRLKTPCSWWMPSRGRWAGRTAPMPTHTSLTRQLITRRFGR